MKKTFEELQEEFKVKKCEKVNRVLDYIRNNQGRNVQQLARDLKISRSGMFYIIRDLEFCGCIYSNILINQRGYSERKLYTIKNEKEKI